MIKFSSLILALLAFTSLSAQDKESEDDNNLVPNWSFEKFDEGLRRVGEFELTEDWANASTPPSDLFATNVRSNYVKVPDNIYGYEEPYDGDNYASFVSYTYRSKKIKKSYVTVRLKSKMKENNLYCVKFRVSLAERSRYATNGIGVVLTKGKVSENTETTIKQPNVILSDKNETVNQTEGWWEFCKRYAAKGTEQYLTIGNFKDDNSTVTEQMELPAKYAEKGAEPIALYFLDGVEVRSIGTDENCGCENTKIPESKVIYSASTQMNE